MSTKRVFIIYIVVGINKKHLKKIFVQEIILIKCTLV